MSTYVGGWRNLRWKCGRGVLVCVCSAAPSRPPCKSAAPSIFFNSFLFLRSSPLLPFNSFWCVLFQFPPLLHVALLLTPPLFFFFCKLAHHVWINIPLHKPNYTNQPIAHLILTKPIFASSSFLLSWAFSLLSCSSPFF